MHGQNHIKLVCVLFVGRQRLGRVLTTKASSYNERQRDALFLRFIW